MSETGGQQSGIKLGESVATQERLAEYRKMIGTRLRIRNIFNRLACEDAIRHFCDGIGDPNPLWRDVEYAKKTRYGGIVAPPSWLYSVFPTWVQHGMSGLHAIPGGNDWKFYKPILLNDFMTPECEVVDIQEKPRSRFAGKIIVEYQEARYFNQKGELVATATTANFRAERSAARSKGKYSDIQLPHPWTEEELARIEDEVLAQTARGADVRYWEDVREGEETQQLVRGPICLTDHLAYFIGANPEQIRAHGLALKLYRRHPGWCFYDPATSAKEHLGPAVHLNRDLVKRAGLPYPYGMAPMEQSWSINLLTDWMGDDGWIKRSRSEYRSFVYFSDVIRLQGKVVKKYMDDNGEPCVDIETRAVNQRQENVMPGFSTVILPSKEKGTSPLDRRL